MSPVNSATNAWHSSKLVELLGNVLWIFRPSNYFVTKAKNELGNTVYTPHNGVCPDAMDVTEVVVQTVTPKEM